MRLSDFFSQVAHKVLTAVDLPNAGSRQHEINGTQPLREFFGGRTKGELQWHHFRDEAEPRHDQGGFTFYDARAKGAARTGRTEWRLYYFGDFLSACKVGDILILAKARDGHAVHAFVFDPVSQWWSALRAYLGEPDVGRRASLLGRAVLEESRAGLIQFLDELGLDPRPSPSPSIEDEATALLASKEAKKLGFPISRAFSEAAREGLDHTSPDEALVAWIEREEQLFRACESRVMEARLRQGFKTVDDFASAALSMLNRRKSRMGRALQNHLSEIFKRSGVRYEAEKRTEGRNKPDFLFPGGTDYHNPLFPERRLRMLAAKSSCKDRWRQILTEAARIPKKHLCTLQPSISRNQTDEMANQRVQLVIPAALARYYSDVGVQTIADFVEEVTRLQA